MFGALLTALFFGVTPVCANQAIRLLGVARANFWRLAVAATALGAWAFAFGQGLSGPFGLFFLAGAVGFGLGGMCMFLALPRLGAPLSSLMVESLSAVCATGLAYLWYGDAVTPGRLAWAALILAGVAVGIRPYVREAAGAASAGAFSSMTRAGVAFAALSGLGQACSIVISRKALLSMKLAGLPVSLSTAAFQRLLGGMAAALVLWALYKLLLKPTRPEGPIPAASGPPVKGPAWMWVGLNALFGPILGVTCLIWALKTMQPGLAQTIAATATLVSVPFARWLNGHKPPALYYLGCLIALAGLAGMRLSG